MNDPAGDDPGDRPDGSGHLGDLGPAVPTSTGGAHGVTEEEAGRELFGAGGRPNLAELADREQAYLAERRAGEPAQPDTPMYLSHHWPEDYDRCQVVFGLHICRRCLVLYPLAIVTAIAVGAGEWWPHGWDPWVLWLLPLPGVVEFVADNLRVIEYSARRQVILSAAGAFAAGVGYVRYLDHTTDALVWSVVFTYGGICLASALAGYVVRRRRVRAGDLDPPDPTS